MELVHNNEHYYPECHVYSDDKYDYAIVNGESLTRYYGPNGGDYESICLHSFYAARQLLEKEKWLLKLLLKDKGKLYKHHKDLIQRIIEDDYYIRVLETIIECKG